MILEYKFIQYIPSIDEKIATTIISVIGKIDRLKHPSKLVAFAGIDPSFFESGTYKGTLNLTNNDVYLILKTTLIPLLDELLSRSVPSPSLVILRVIAWFD